MLSIHMASVGAVPQDLKFNGEQTWLQIGNGNTIREFATLHLGTVTGDGETTVGSGNFFMAYSHVAHDCHIGNGVVRTPVLKVCRAADKQDQEGRNPIQEAEVVELPSPAVSGVPAQRTGCLLGLRC